MCVLWAVTEDARERDDTAVKFIIFFTPFLSPLTMSGFFLCESWVNNDGTQSNALCSEVWNALLSINIWIYTLAHVFVVIVYMRHVHDGASSKNIVLFLIDLVFTIDNCFLFSRPGCVYTLASIVEQMAEQWTKRWWKCSAAEMDRAALNWTASDKQYGCARMG